MASIKGYTLKGLQTMQGQEWDVVRCTIAKNGKTIAEFFDDGSGGEANVNMTGTMKRSEFEKEIKNLTPFYQKRSGAIGRDYGFGNDICYDAGLLVGDLRNLMTVQKAYRKSLRSFENKNSKTGYTLGCVVLWTDTSINFTWVPYKVRDEATEQKMKDIGLKMQREYEQKNGPERRTIVEYFYSEDDFDLLKESA